MGVKLEVFGASDVGRMRSNNEDSFVVADLNEPQPVATKDGPASIDVRERGVLLAVSDGMGGEQAGEVASALVVDWLRRELASGEEVSGPPSKERLGRIERAVSKANVEVWRAARAPDKSGMGATLTAVLVDGGTAHIAEVGDSRAYLVRSGRIRQMTRDQSFVQLLLESGVISPEEAESYPHKNVILQAMGQRPDVTVAVGRLELRRGDVLLLCSDGLSNKVEAEEMKETVASSEDIGAAVRKLIALANERGGEDNVTVVVAVAAGDDLPAPIRAETVTQTFEVLQEYAPPPSKPPAGNGDKPMPEDKDAKKDEPKADAKKDEPKADAKKDEPKADATKDEPRADAKKDEPKADAKKDEPKADAKKDEPKADAKKDEPKADAKDEGAADAVKKGSGGRDGDDEDEDEAEDERGEQGDGEAQRADAKPGEAAAPTQEQRVKEMLTLALVFLGVGLLVYYLFKS